MLCNRRMDAGEDVLGIIGHLNSGQTLAAMERYRDMPLVVITPTASEQSLTERGYANFFRVNANDAVQAAVDAAFLVDEAEGRNRCRDPQRHRVRPGAGDIDYPRTGGAGRGAAAHA